MHPSLLLLACTYLISTWAAPAFAGTAQTSFAVKINLQTSNGLTDSGLCRSASSIGIFGAAVTVVCATGSLASFSGNAASLPWTTMRNNTYRFITQISKAGEALGTIDSYTGGGTVTSWRVIRLANRDYLEMMIHW